MNNLQRGIYQPLADKVPIYDLADEDPEEERSRAPLLSSSPLSCSRPSRGSCGWPTIRASSAAGKALRS